MPFIGAFGQTDVTVPAGQSIIVGAFGIATAQVLYGQTSGQNPPMYSPQATVSGGASTFGSFASAQAVRVVAGPGEVEYVIGAAPQLTKTNTAQMPTTQYGAGQMVLESATNGITAFAGGGQASATQLTSEINRVTVVATAGDSVKLPAAAAGLTIYLANRAANPMQVYGAGTDVINGVATATGVSQMPSSEVIYTCTVAGQWETEGLATGFSGGFATASFAGGLVAHAGGGQVAGLPITTMVSRFAAVATIADSATLPAAVANISIGPLTIANGSANSMNLFPAVGDQINALGANAAFAIAGGKAATLYSTGAGQWHAVLSA